MAEIFDSILSIGLTAVMVSYPITLYFVLTRPNMEETIDFEEIVEGFDRSKKKKVLFLVVLEIRKIVYSLTFVYGRQSQSL